MSSKKIDVDLILTLSQEGATTTATAEKAGCSRRTVTNVRKAHGFRSPRLLTPERRARIEVMLDDGWSFAEIHRTEGASPDTLQRHFPGRAWTRQQIAEFATMNRIARETRKRAAA